MSGGPQALSWASPSSHFSTASSRSYASIVAEYAQYLDRWDDWEFIADEIIHGSFTLLPVTDALADLSPHCPILMYSKSREI